MTSELNYFVMDDTGERPEFYENLPEIPPDIIAELMQQFDEMDGNHPESDSTS